MRTRHHRLPKSWRHRAREFFDISKKGNISWVSEREHQAWNVLTRNSQMTLGETIESLNRFIPPNVKLVLQPQ